MNIAFVVITIISILPAFLMLLAALLLLRINKHISTVVLSVISTAYLILHFISVIYPMLPALGIQSLGIQPTFIFYSNLISYSEFDLSILLSLLWLLAISSLYTLYRRSNFNTAEQGAAANP